MDPSDGVNCTNDGLPSRQILSSESHTGSGFGTGRTAKEVIEHLDGICITDFGASYRALFAFGDARVASVSPNTGDGQVDWVLAPYTQYYNASGQLVWTTDESALLGVSGSTPTSLNNPIYATFRTGRTGMETDWTTVEDDCDGWTLRNNSGSEAYGRADVSTSEFLRSSTGCCGCAGHRFYCVEQ